jgi:hypothetical protein
MGPPALVEVVASFEDGPALWRRSSLRRSRGRPAPESSKQCQRSSFSTSTGSGSKTSVLASPSGSPVIGFTAAVRLARSSQPPALSLALMIKASILAARSGLSSGLPVRLLFIPRLRYASSCLVKIRASKRTRISLRCFFVCSFTHARPG